MTMYSPQFENHLMYMGFFSLFLYFLRIHPPGKKEKGWAEEGGGWPAWQKKEKEPCLLAWRKFPPPPHWHGRFECEGEEREKRCLPFFARGANPAQVDQDMYLLCSYVGRRVCVFFPGTAKRMHLFWTMKLKKRRGKKNGGLVLLIELLPRFLLCGHGDEFENV